MEIRYLIYMVFAVVVYSVHLCLVGTRSDTCLSPSSQLLLGTRFVFPLRSSRSSPYWDIHPNLHILSVNLISISLQCYHTTSIFCIWRISLRNVGTQSNINYKMCQIAVCADSIVVIGQSEQKQFLSVQKETKKM